MANKVLEKINFNGETYDIGLQIDGPEFIVGTWTGATGTWTGVTKESELYDGKQILLYMPFNGSGNATLNLTLSGGGTTGAKNVYFESTNRFTTHKGQNAILHLVYKTALKLSNGTTYEGWWYIANRDTNDTAFYSKEIYSNILAGANKIYPHTFLLQLPDERWESPILSSSTGATKNPNTNGFVLGQMIWYNGDTTINENSKPATYTLCYTHSLVDYRYSFNLTDTNDGRLVVNKPIFLKGKVTNGLFYLDTTRWVTQILPTSDDGFVYIYLGNAYDWYRGSYSDQHPIYWYKNGSIKLFSDYASVAGSANSVAWNNVSGKPSNYTPSSHVHGNISNNGELSTADMAVVTGANKQITTANLATSSPNAASTTSTTFIDTISQNSLGKITATKKTLPTASTSIAGIVKLGTGDNDAATGTHVHSYAASNSPGGSATSAIGFATAKTIALTGNVTGSATGGNGNNGWSIATTIGQGVVTNGMLVNSKMTIVGNEISLGGSLTAAALKSDLGLKALAYKDSLTANDVGALPLTGGTLTGALTLSGAPTANLHAATKQYVDQSFAANDAMIFKGTIGSSGATVTALPNSHSVGWTYRVLTAGTYAGIKCEVGDLIICIADGTTANNAHWTVAQTNIDGTVIGPTSAIDGNIVLFDGTSGKLIKNSSYSPSSFAAASHTHTVTTPTGATTRTTDVALNTTTVNSITAIGTLPSLTITDTNVVTGGTTTAIPNISKKTVVTGVTKKTVVIGGSTTDIPNISKKTVVTSATAAKASYASGVLTISDGSVTTGDSVGVGTAIKAYTSLTTGDSVTVTTGDSVTVGTAINAYTTLTTSAIGSASDWDTGSLPTKGTNTTVATSVKTQPTFTVNTQSMTLSHTAS